jgi:hypothetical protein
MVGEERLTVAQPQLGQGVEQHSLEQPRLGGGRLGRKEGPGGQLGHPVEHLELEAVACPLGQTLIVQVIGKRPALGPVPDPLDRLEVTVEDVELDLQAGGPPAGVVVARGLDRQPHLLGESVPL